MIFNIQSTDYTIQSVQSLSHLQLFASPRTAAHQASLSIANSQSLLKPTPIGSMMPANHLILCRPLLLLPSVFPSVRVFSNELALHIRWSKYWNFSFSISPSNEYSGLISFRIEPQHCLTQWNYEPCRVGTPKTDRSWWRVLTKRGLLEKGMANHFSILALRTPWTVAK